jgi:hypothetical protein
MGCALDILRQCSPYCAKNAFDAHLGDERLPLKLDDYWVIHPPVVSRAFWFFEELLTLRSRIGFKPGNYEPGPHNTFG